MDTALLMTVYPTPLHNQTPTSYTECLEIFMPRTLCTAILDDIHSVGIALLRTHIIMARVYTMGPYKHCTRLLLLLPKRKLTGLWGSFHGCSNKILDETTITMDCTGKILCSDAILTLSKLHYRLFKLDRELPPLSWAVASIDTRGG